MLSAQGAEVGVPGQGHASNPKWSPDGQWLAFEVNDYGGALDLYLVRIQDGMATESPTKVTAAGDRGSQFSGGGRVVATPVWHPRGMLFFEGSRSGSNTRFYERRPNSPQVGELLSRSRIDGDLSWATISPDGMWLSFVSDSSGAGDIFRWTYGASEVEKIVSSPYSEMAPQYNEDGSRLVYSRKHRGGQDIFVWEGASPLPWIGGSGDQSRPVWSGQDVVYFTDERGEGRWDIAVSGAPGQKSVVARDVRLPQRATPALTPDGQWVAYGVEDPEQSGRITFSRLSGSGSTSFDSGFAACGEPALIEVESRIYMAYTALSSNDGSDWRKLHIVDVTNLVGN